MGKVVYRSKMFNVERQTVRLRPGHPFTFDKIKGPNTVGIVAVMPDGRILLERQYRYSVGKHLYEIPAGHIDKGETAKQAASRELQEETGYVPGSLKAIFKSYPSPGSKTELATVYLASGLKKYRTNREPDELMTLRFVSLAKAVDMIKRNQIRDQKTIAALLFYAMYLSKYD